MTDVQNTQNTQDAQAAEDAQAKQSAPASPATPSPPNVDKPRPLDDLIGSIQAAVAPGVSAEVRTVGAAACRAILTALETPVGQPLGAAPPPAATSTAAPTSPLAAMLSQLASMPREQLVEFVINRLRGALPPGTPTQVAAGPRFHLIQIPQMRRPESGS